jgi:hypothetical protein
MDEAAYALQAAMRAWLHSDTGEDRVVRIDGRNLERWVMKCTCGVLAAGWHKPRGEERDNLVLGPQVPDAIFGQGRLDGPRGLYVLSKPRTPLVAGPGDYVGWHPAMYRNDPSKTDYKVIGLIVQLTGITMISIVDPIPDLAAMLRKMPTQNSTVDWSATEVLHRPLSLQYELHRRSGVVEPGRLRIDLTW